MRYEFGHKLRDGVLLLLASGVALASSSAHEPHSVRESPPVPGSRPASETEVYSVTTDCPGAPAQGTLTLAWKGTLSAAGYQRGALEPFESNAMDLGFPSRTFVRIGDTILNATRLAAPAPRTECAALVGSGAAGQGESGRLLRVGEGVVFLCVDAASKAERCTAEMTLLSYAVSSAGAPEAVARGEDDADVPAREVEDVNL